MAAKRCGHHTRSEPYNDTPTMNARLFALGLWDLGIMGEGDTIDLLGQCAVVE